MASDRKNRILLLEILNEFYKIRSQIVHEGHTEEGNRLVPNSMIFINITGIARQIFLRYIGLLYLELEGSMSDRILPDAKQLLSKDKRAKTIAYLLDALVLDPCLTAVLEEKMKELGVYEDWTRRAGFDIR